MFILGWHGEIGYEFLMRSGRLNSMRLTIPRTLRILSSYGSLKKLHLLWLLLLNSTAQWHIALDRSTPYCFPVCLLNILGDCPYDSGMAGGLSCPSSISNATANPVVMELSPTTMNPLPFVYSYMPVMVLANNLISN